MKKSPNESTHGIIQPNLLNRRFNCVVPFAAICVDITTVISVSPNGIEKSYEVLCFIDLATAYIVYSEMKSAWTAKQIVRRVEHILELKEKFGYGSVSTILHSDRGPCFTSKTYDALNAKKLLQLSMSGRAEPGHNSVIERFFRTLKENIDKFDPNKPCRLPLNQKPKTSKFLLTKTELNRRVHAIINAHNNKWSPKRALGFIPSTLMSDLQYIPKLLDNDIDKLEAIGLLSHTTQQKELRKKAETLKKLVVQIVNQPNISSDDAKQKVNQAADDMTNTAESMQRQIDTNRSLIDQLQFEQNEQTDSIKEYIKAQTGVNKLIFSKFDKQIDQNNETQRVLDALVNKVNELQIALYQKQTKTKYIPRNKKPRHPLSFSLVNNIVQLTHQNYFTRYKVRDLLAIIILSALGCRINEIRCFTIGEIKHLIARKRIKYTLSKRASSELVTQPITDTSAQYIQVVFNKYCELWPNSIDTDPIFCSQRGEKKPLELKAFNKAVNKTVSFVCKDLGVDELTITSHSARIGYVTRLVRTNETYNKIAQLTHHLNPHSVVSYDRYVMTEQEMIAKMTAAEDAELNLADYYSKEKPQFNDYAKNRSMLKEAEDFDQ